MNNEPSFFVVGAQKAGTTALHEYLKEHPQVFLPEIKETKWFVKDDRYTGVFQDYLNEHFSTVGEGQVVGEIDPDIMDFPVALERMCIHMDMSAKKIIFVLRDPVTRAFSHYLMTYRRGRERLSFDEAIRAEASRLSDGTYYSRINFGYAEKGFYAQQIKRFLKIVPQENILYLTSDMLSRSPKETMCQLCRFLGVDERFYDDYSFERVHQAQVPKYPKLMQRIVQKDTWEKRFLRKIIPMSAIRSFIWGKLYNKNLISGTGQNISEEMSCFLKEHFRKEVAELEQITGLDLSRWR